TIAPSEMRAHADPGVRGAGLRGSQSTAAGVLLCSLREDRRWMGNLTPLFSLLLPLISDASSSSPLLLLRLPLPFSPNHFFRVSNVSTSVLLLHDELSPVD